MTTVAQFTIPQIKAKHGLHKTGAIAAMCVHLKTVMLMQALLSRDKLTSTVDTNQSNYTS